MSSLRWSGEQSGRAAIEPGAELRVRLWAAPALGSSWRCAQLEGGIKVVEDRFSCPAGIQGGAIQTFRFRAIEPGPGHIELVSGRPGDPAASEARRARIEVSVA